MTERPILFSAPMVRALLADTKTQTRRRYKPRDPEPWEVVDERRDGSLWPFMQDEAGQFHELLCPYGTKGDHLWVRETFCYSDGHATPEGTVCYRANLPADDFTGFKWKPSIFMRRVDSRITLEVTDVRFQRLQDISDEDARAEGIVPIGDLHLGDGWGMADGDSFRNARNAYRSLWNAINSKGSWETNPWVWAISFGRLSK